MTFDFAAHLRTTTRVVRDTTHDGKPAKALIATRVYETDAADLWEALTSLERLPRWFPGVSGDLELGGRYQIEGNASGSITACEPPEHFALTWEFQGSVSWVDVRLTGVEGGTKLTLEHLAPVWDEHYDKFGPGAGGVGWELALLGLEWHLADPAADVSTEGAAWAESPEARGFYAQSSALWGEAAIASGEEAQHARAAAERTRAFYSGEQA
ncbi:MAG: SRPBCC family protein [Myxococcales bacterium]|nr:SRPBCC family protein [Myxococcales bacterium]